MAYKYLMRFPFLVLVSAIALFSCKDKKTTSLSGEAPVDVMDFMGFFRHMDLPVIISDTTLDEQLSDSLLISPSVFHTFVPDSVLNKDFGKNEPKIYPLGKTKEKGKETYLFVKAVHGPKRVAYVICFDRKNKYLTALPLVKVVAGDNYISAYGSLDKKFQITTYRERKNKPGEISFKRNVFIYNDVSNDFTLIVTEPGQEVSEDVVNPIDTFSQKNKFAGDYQVDKRNFISFRDSHKPSEIIFFTHFEKNKGECKGELKGTARFVSPRIAQYKENGNPCTLEFTFNVSSVAMKEVEGCGSYRDIKCFFEGVFPKKKKSKSKTQKAQVTKKTR